MQPGQLNLGLQIVILALILAGFIFKLRGKYLVHGVLMFVGVILNIVSFALVMGPSILGFEVIITQPLRDVSLVAVVHGIMGGIALISGAVLAFSWRLKTSTQICVKRKRLMKPTIILWTMALLFGIWLYTILYGV
jgi:hypothetical protein